MGDEVAKLCCGSCYFWRQATGRREGRCHVNPPTHEGFPVVEATGWCGSHLLVEEEKASKQETNHA